MCPFCYIGKRKFEQGLERFSHGDQVSIEWKAFQLDPTLVTDPKESIYVMLAKKKGIAPEQAKMMIANVTNIARDVGLTMNFDRSIIANSFKAHRFSAYAKAHGKGVEAEEQLFNAYFTEGKNIDDTNTLISLGDELGLDSSGLRIALESSAYSKEVTQDIAEARSMGVNGVPYFRINNKFVVSGAQDPAKFTQVLERAYDDWVSNNKSKTVETSEGDLCDINGNC